MLALCNNTIQDMGFAKYSVGEVIKILGVYYGINFIKVNV